VNLVVDTSALYAVLDGNDGRHSDAVAAWADLLPVIRTIWVDEATHRSAVHAHLVSARRRLSLVDCVSFEAMRRASLRDAFCFDPHFAEQGFRTLPAKREVAPERQYSQTSTMVRKITWAVPCPPPT
jgi:predicted nucleic acid-binding protein